MNSCAERVEPDFLDDDLIQIIASGAAGDPVVVMNQVDSEVLRGMSNLRLIDLINAQIDLEKRVASELARRYAPLPDRVSK